MNQPTQREALLSPRRLTLAGLAIAIGMAIAFILFVVTADGVDGLAGGRLGGDWPAFHTAGLLARTNPEALFDVDAQRAIMAEYLGDSYTPFPYPPLFAFLFVPATYVSYGLGYATYVVLLLVAAIVAVRWLLDLYGADDDRWRTVGMLGATTYAGTFLSYAGAQNATLTLLILVGAHRLLVRGAPAKAGLVLGLLWFKPQYAVPALGLVAVAGYVRTAAWAVVPGVLVWLASAVVFGVDWVGRWGSGILRATDAGNRRFNTQNTVSMVEYLRGRVEQPWGDAIAIGLAVVVGVCFVLLVRRYRQPHVLLPLVCVALLLTALHALRYELALLVPAFAAGLAARGMSGVRVAVALYVGGWVMVAPVHPIVRVLYVIVAFVWTMRVVPAWVAARMDIRPGPPSPVRRSASR